jgi:phosphoribosylaminoimidazolecarboxamide formyltransferase/IMP cyclohydrolase
MVVVNLQPLDDLVNKEDLAPEELMEQVDIGGIAMIRSAAKNFRYVSVVVNPSRYSALSHELLEREGQLSFETRFRLAQEAFQVTATYDRVVSDYLARCEPPQE